MENLQKEIKKRLRQALDYLGKSIDDVSEDTKFSKSKIKGLRSGNQFITPELSLLFEELYSINASWLLLNRGEMFIPSFDLDNKDTMIEFSANEILQKLEDRENEIDKIRSEIAALKSNLKS